MFFQGTAWGEEPSVFLTWAIKHIYYMTCELHLNYQAHHLVILALPIFHVKFEIHL